jgi:DNA-binding transcriptional LysR family regulator
MAPLDIPLLRAFVTAADVGSLSRAAALLHLTQPALSKQIQALESSLDVKLFDRAGRGVQLTSAGHDLLRRGRQLLLDAESLAERARVLRGGATGVLKVGATSMTLESFLTPFLPTYRRRCPDVDVLVSEDGGMRLLRQVDGGDLHLAITGPRDPTLRSRLLFPVRSLAVMARMHPLARRRTVELGEVIGEPLLVLRPVFTMRQLFEAACETACLRPRFVFETSVPHALLALARINYGVAIVPSNQVISARSLGIVPIVHEGKSLGQWMAVSWHARRFLPPYAETFVEELTAYTRLSYPGREFSYAAPVPRLDWSRSATPGRARPHRGRSTGSTIASEHGDEGSPTPTPGSP